ncbi:MFS transporter [Carbonactinospora thermoautotrophica]|uniref:MFS transporter n=1 Tax=Carbonactinospora thermoautotrophica TaxID=1469144 RepID=UPI00226DB6A6|nr:MFS transporter [Carbonactinospora thermoautotrophica]
MSMIEAEGVQIGRARRGPWRIFSLLALVQFVVVLDGSVVVVALPSIQADLGFSATGLGWVMNAYLLVFGGFLLLGGRAADLVGRRRLVFIGTAVFTLASLVCGVSAESWHLILGRVAQGLGAALAAPAALALVTDVFPEGDQRNRALAIWGGMGGIAGAAGILLGGLLSAVAWEWVFLINVPVGAAVLLLGRRMLSASQAEATGGLDAFGAVSGTGGLCLLLYAVVNGSELGWGSTSTLIGFGAAVVLLAAFVVRQSKATAPLVPRLLFRLPNVVFGNAVNALLGALLFGGFFVSTLFLQQARGYDPFTASLLIVPMNLAMLVGSQAATRLMGRFGPANALLSGLLGQAVALGWWASALDAEQHVLFATVLPATVWCCGLGITIVAAYVLCTSGLTGSVAGAASGLVTTTFEIGGAVGVAVLTTVADRRIAALLGDSTADAVRRAEALASGHAIALWGALALAVVAVALTLWLKRSGPVEGQQDAQEA